MTKNFILGKLTPFQNRQNVITSRQGVNDIINGLLQTHDQYKDEYDKISHFFYTGTEKGTAQKIWNYLKENVTYNIEPDSFQTLRSPAAILSIGSGADCKSYALFSNGILDSLRRKGFIKSDVSFRFAGYGFNNDLEHVFSVLKTNKGEIWIDPVLNQFDQKKEPNYYKDKNIKNMSLVAMAGIFDTVDPLGFDLGTPIDQGVSSFDTATVDPGMTTADGTPIIYSDPSTGVYQEPDGTFYLNDGTPLNNYDPSTGVYQEEDGTYYLQDGTALNSYDPTHGVYQETDGTYYTLDGTALSYFDPNTGAYQEQGSSVFYDNAGNPIIQSSVPMVPSRTSSVLTSSGGGSGGGGGFSPGGGGGGSKANNTALDKALTLLNKLFPTNAKPQTAPRSVIKKPVTNTTQSNTNTYLMIGLGVAAVYLLTKKGK
jgi:uncharacterized membrane protein YgcG